MNIEEYKKLARNKIEADALTQQVRDVIKTTKWQKQDMREGFKETFKPLIKSQDIVKKSIDEQQNATIAQLKKNQLALTQGFEQFNRLADMRELPYPEDLDDNDKKEGWDVNWAPSSIYDTRLNLEKNFDNPHQLLKRLELLGGSILAGNNGVIPEFSQIAHLLNQMKVITKKQLNDLLKNYIFIK